MPLKKVTPFAASIERLALGTLRQKDHRRFHRRVARVMMATGASGRIAVPATKGCCPLHSP